MEKKLYCLMIFLFAVPLGAMEGFPLDKSLMTLNNILDELSTIVTMQKVLIGGKTISITRKQVDVLKNKASENFSSYIADLPEVAEGEEETIFLPEINSVSQKPFDDKTKTELFNYLANWQTTKSKLNTFGDDLVINMIITANALGMENIVDVLSNEYARRQQAALYANPEVWWNSIGKNLNDLPPDLQFKLSEYLLLTQKFKEFIISQNRKIVEGLEGKPLRVLFRPIKGVNLLLDLLNKETVYMLGMLYEYQQKELSMTYKIKYMKNFFLYQRGNEFALSLNFFKRDKFFITKSVGWSPNGKYILAYDPAEREEGVMATASLLSWDEQNLTWDIAKFEYLDEQDKVRKLTSFKKKIGLFLCWSPDSTLLVTREEKEIVVYWNKEKDIWVESRYPIKGKIYRVGVAFSFDSHYLAIYDATYASSGYKIYERGAGNTFNFIFEEDRASFPYSFPVYSLKWQPGNNKNFVVERIGSESRSIELWQKNNNEWILKQEIIRLFDNLTLWKSNFITWSPDGTYLAIANRNVPSTNVDRQEKIQLFINKNDKWQLSDEWNPIESTDPQPALKTSIIEVSDIIWRNDGESFISVIDAYDYNPDNFELRDKVLTYAKLWVKGRNSWQGFVVRSPFSTPWISWDMHDNYFAAIMEDKGKENSHLFVWDFNIVNSLRYITIGQTFLLIDWYNKRSKGEPFVIQSEYKQGFDDLPDALKKLIY